MLALALIAIFTLAIPVVVLFVRAYDARGLPNLEPWHTTRLAGEYIADDEGRVATLEQYRSVEAELFRQVERRVVVPGPLDDEHVFNRFARGSFSDPDRFARDWNRTLELTPDRPRGGVLLLHGMSDAPYSWRATAQALCDNGYYVLVPRLPGHGTVPSALRDVRWQDWAAVVRLGARHVRERLGADDPFIIGGYSVGGALAVRYTLDALRDPALPVPDRAVLLSPAIGVTAFARLAGWHKSLSWTRTFRKFQWQSIEPEREPFKYSSIPKNGGRQSELLIRGVQDDLAVAHRNGTLAEFPPTLAAQSAVDSTVISEDLVEHLFERLDGDHHELVVFDINRRSYLEHFLRAHHRGVRKRLESRTLPFRCTMVTNEDTASAEVVARSMPANADAFGHEEALPMEWPQQVYSLSHVALPFPPDDPVYGDPAPDEQIEHFRANYLQLRGERALLSVPADSLMRMRYNPFYDYLQHRITGWVVDTQ